MFVSNKLYFEKLGLFIYYLFIYTKSSRTASGRNVRRGYPSVYNKRINLKVLKVVFFIFLALGLVLDYVKELYTRLKQFKCAIKY